MPTIIDVITKPFSVHGDLISSRAIADAIDALANTPARFAASTICHRLLPFAEYHQQQEAANRLMQRWRKAGLVEFAGGRWHLTRGSWDMLKCAALNARQSVEAA